MIIKKKKQKNNNVTKHNVTDIDMLVSKSMEMKGIKMGSLEYFISFLQVCM